MPPLQDIYVKGFYSSCCGVVSSPSSTDSLATALDVLMPSPNATEDESGEMVDLEHRDNPEDGSWPFIILYQLLDIRNKSNNNIRRRRVAKEWKWCAAEHLKSSC